MLCKRAQISIEIVLQYVTVLRELASTCDFGDCQDAMIHEQLVEQLLDKRIRERLSRENARVLLVSPPLLLPTIRRNPATAAGPKDTWLIHLAALLHQSHAEDATKLGILLKCVALHGRAAGRLMRLNLQRKWIFL